MYWPDLPHPPLPRAEAGQGEGAARASALAAGLVQAVLAQRFEDTPDAMRGGRAVEAFPSIDLAVARFDPRSGGSPGAAWANVLFSREHPQGLTAEMNGTAGVVGNVRYDADIRDAGGTSIAWQPGADWSRLAWRPLTTRPAPGAGAVPPARFVAPYPASLLKLMVAVGLALAADRGLAEWPAEAEPMIVDSDNDATTACVALLHRAGAVDLLHQRFAACGLYTLRLDGTRPDGGWRNADGAGVGRIQMTAWDTVRLLWLIDAGAPPPPWLPPGAPPLLKPASRDRLRGLLRAQRHDHVLSSGSLRDVPGWVPGLPDAPTFAHKTGFTENYASDAGIVDAGGDGGPHYLVAVLTNLGTRYAPDPRCATTWRLPALGASVHRLVAGGGPR